MENLRAKVDTKAQANLQSFKANTVYASQLSQDIYSEYSVSGIWSSGYQIYIMNDFTGYTNQCSPTAGTNLVYYWAHYGSPEQSGLWTGSVFKDLYKYMKTNNGHVGTVFDDVTNGLIGYADSRNCPVLTDDFENKNWNSLTDNLYHDRPVIILTHYTDPKYSGHALLAVGFQDTSAGQYIRVADGWSRTFSNFYKFPGYIDDQRTVWW